MLKMANNIFQQLFEALAANNLQGKDYHVKP